MIELIKYNPKNLLICLIKSPFPDLIGQDIFIFIMNLNSTIFKSYRIFAQIIHFTLEELT